MYADSAFYALRKQQVKKRKLVDRRASKSRKIRFGLYSPLLVGCKRNFPTCLTYFWVIVFFFRSYVICPGIMFTRRSLISWPRYPWLFLQWPRSCLRIYLARATRNPPKLGSKFHITCSNFCSSKIVACMTLLRT
jgi:hypothetical protein